MSVSPLLVIGGLGVGALLLFKDSNGAQLLPGGATIQKDLKGIVDAIAQAGTGDKGAAGTSGAKGTVNSGVPAVQLIPSRTEPSGVLVVPTAASIQALPVGGAYKVTQPSGAVDTYTNYGLQNGSLSLLTPQQEATVPQFVLDALRGK